MPRLTIVRSAPALEADALLSDELALSLYFEQHLVVRRVTEQVIKNYRGIVLRMLEFTGKPVWEVTPADYERWILSVLKRRLIKISTQRSYQTAVRGFYAYLTDDPEFQGLVLRAAGHRLQNPVNARTSVVHRVEDETEGAATAPLMRDEFIRLQQVIDHEIAASANAPMRLRAHQRYKVMISLQYYSGIRVHELVALNRRDFQPLVSTRAAMGRYGAVRVRGKRSRSAPKPIAIAPVVSSAFPPLAEWYFKEVRPKFAEKDADAKQAVFLNCRGQRISRWAYMSQMRTYLRKAGLWVPGRGTHATRRSTLTHASEAVDMDFAQMLARHANQSTTQVYVKLPKAARAARLNAMVRLTMARGLSRQKPSKPAGD